MYIEYILFIRFKMLIKYLGFLLIKIKIDIREDFDYDIDKYLGISFSGDGCIVEGWEREY